jgi:hypothetical protein
MVRSEDSTAEGTQERFSGSPSRTHQYERTAGDRRQNENAVRLKTFRSQKPLYYLQCVASQSYMSR